jgi:SulP family sulfate permease
MILSSVWNLVYAVGIGLVIASLMFMKKIGDLMAKNSEVTKLEDFKNWDDEMEFPEYLREEVIIKHLEGPLFFGSTTDFQHLASQIPDDTKVIVLRMGRVPYMDQSGLYAVEDLVNSMSAKGKIILMVKLKKQPRYMMERIDIIPDLVKEEYIFDSFTDCLKWIKANVKDTIPKAV